MLAGHRIPDSVSRLDAPLVVATRSRLESLKTRLTLEPPWLRCDLCGASPTMDYKVCSRTIHLDVRPPLQKIGWNLFLRRLKEMAAVARFSALGLAFFFVVQRPIRSTAPPPGS